MFPSENHRKVPIYLFDTAEKKQPLTKLDSANLVDEEDMFRPTQVIHSETSLHDLLQHVPYGIFLQHIFSLYEKGLITKDAFVPIFITQVTYFFKGLQEYVFNDTWDKDMIVRHIKSLILRFGLEDKVSITDITFQIEHGDSSDLQFDEIIDAVSNRMKQLASMYSHK